MRLAWVLSVVQVLEEPGSINRFSILSNLSLIIYDTLDRVKGFDSELRKLIDMWYT